MVHSSTRIVHRLLRMAASMRIKPVLEAMMMIEMELDMERMKNREKIEKQTVQMTKAVCRAKRDNMESRVASDVLKDIVLWYKADNEMPDGDFAKHEASDSARKVFFFTSKISSRNLELETLTLLFDSFTILKCAFSRSSGRLKQTVDV